MNFSGLTSLFEFIRYIRLTMESFVGDYNLRHPDTRRRLISELDLLYRPTFHKFMADIPRSLRDTSSVFSVLDWHLLTYWNELTRQIQSLGQINEYLSSPPQSHAFEQHLKDRLSEIRAALIKSPIPSPSSWWQLLKYRWINAALRDEARYLLLRARQHSHSPIGLAS